MSFLSDLNVAGPLALKGAMQLSRIPGFRLNSTTRSGIISAVTLLSSESGIGVKVTLLTVVSLSGTVAAGEEAASARKATSRKWIKAPNGDEKFSLDYSF